MRRDNVSVEKSVVVTQIPPKATIYICFAPGVGSRIGGCNQKGPCTVKADQRILAQKNLVRGFGGKGGLTLACMILLNGLYMHQCLSRMVVKVNNNIFVII